MEKPCKVYWKKEPDKHNYPAAASYLNLIFGKKEVEKLIKSLRHAKVTRFRAKDIFRASKLSLLGISNSHVQRDQLKISQGQKLSPILLVRDPDLGLVIVADGYHRLCAVYSHHENAWIPSKIVSVDRDLL
jgi:hypothetical protein